jgi:hypothetical protein
LLEQASQALQQLKAARQEDFPLLNKSTRLVQRVQGCVHAMKDSDQKLAWRRPVAAQLRAKCQAQLCSVSANAAAQGLSSAFLFLYSPALPQ